MGLATFKDLCIDANNPAVLGSFWAEVLGLELHHQADGDAVLTGQRKVHTIWVNRVAESKTVKHRVHLDVHGSSVARLQGLGATVIDDSSFRWIVMADPEGGEFCLFLRDAVPAYRLYEVAVDCVDHEAASRWWTSVLGGRRGNDPAGFSFIEQIPNAPFESISFESVDGAKQTKNRIHLDLVAPNLDPLIEAGAVLLRRRDEEIGWDVLADPEGNEFCVFASH